MGNRSRTPRRQQGALAAAEQRSGQQIVDAADAAAQRKKILNCKHDSVEWDPVETEYKGDDVHVWQEGRCRDCKRLVQREFEPNDAHTVTDEPEPEEPEG